MFCQEVPVAVRERGRHVRSHRWMWIRKFIIAFFGRVGGGIHPNTADVWADKYGFARVHVHQHIPSLADLVINWPPCSCVESVARSQTSEARSAGTGVLRVTHRHPQLPPSQANGVGGEGWRGSVAFRSSPERTSGATRTSFQSFALRKKAHRRHSE